MRPLSINNSALNNYTQFAGKNVVQPSLINLPPIWGISRGVHGHDHRDCLDQLQIEPGRPYRQQTPRCHCWQLGCWNGYCHWQQPCLQAYQPSWQMRRWWGYLQHGHDHRDQSRRTWLCRTLQMDPMCGAHGLSWSYNAGETWLHATDGRGLTWNVEGWKTSEKMK